MRLTRYGEYLEVVKTGERSVIRCVKCNHVFCDSKDEVTAHGLVIQRHLSELGGLYGDRDSRFFLREVYCPSCLTRIDCEVVTKDATSTVGIRLADQQHNVDV